MRKATLNWVLDFYVFSNVHVALCAVFSCVASSLVLGIRIHPEVLLVAGGGTLALYCWQRWFGVKQNENPDYPAARHQWNFRNKSVLLLLTAAGAVISLIGLYFLSWLTLKIVAVAGAIGIIYSAPMIPSQGKLIRLRDVTGVKVFVIALTWTIVCVWVPFSVVLSQKTSPVYWELNSQAFVWKWSLIYFFAAAGLTIPFDVRDMDFDKGVLKSLPMIFGAKTMLNVAAAFMILSGVLFWYFECQISSSVFPSGAWRGYLLWSILSALVVVKSYAKQEHYFSFLMDGMLLVLPLFLLS